MKTLKLEITTRSALVLALGVLLSAGLATATVAGTGSRWNANSLEFQGSSGNDAFAFKTNGLRAHFGAGTSDYASSDGTTVTFAGPASFASTLGVTGNLTGSGALISNNGNSTAFQIGNAGGAFKIGATTTDVNTAPTVTACTSPSITWSAGSANFRFAVGSSCTGISSAVITLPATTNCWTCSCFDTGAAKNVRQSACGTTSATVTNYGTSVATAADFTDAASIQCMCRGG